ncbi:SPOR domain-containing protein [Larkinella harenae]
MVSVSDYLKKLLFQYDCIVVPELGGFILHYVPATFVEATGMYMPPRKKIAFNEALKLDDGLLINYMMLHDGCTREAAGQAIRQFAEEMKQTLRQGQIFAIDGVGLFSENEEGKLQFDPEIRHNFQGESYGYQPVSARLVNAVEKTEVPQEVVKLPKEAPIAVEAEEVPARVVAMPVTNTRRQYLAWAAAVLLVCSLGVIVSVKKSPSLVVSSLNPFELFAQEEEAVPASTEPVEKNSVRTAVVDAEPAATRTVPVVPVASPVVMVTPVVKEPVVVAEPKREEAYYLAIAGSFSSKANAKRLMNRLRRAGFETAYILPQTKTKELVKVAAVGSSDKDEILASLEKVSKLAGARAWVCKID